MIATYAKVRLYVPEPRRAVGWNEACEGRATTDFLNTRIIFIYLCVIKIPRYVPIGDSTRLSLSLYIYSIYS